MKKKILTALCVVACLALLSGCGQKEAAEIPAETPVAANAPDEARQEPVQERQSEAPAEIVTPADVEAETETQEEQSTTPTDGGSASDDSQPESFTLDEMIEKLSNTQTVYAVKKGDLFYPIEHVMGYGSIRAENGDGYLDFRPADETILVIDYTQGDEFVVFSTGAPYILLEKDTLTGTHYCIPASFRIDTDGTLRLNNISYDSEIQDNVKTFDECGGTIINGLGTTIEEGFIGECLITGDKDEVIELGGYAGTQYKTVSYVCSGRYYKFGPEENYSDKCENTKDGYAIISSKDVNPLEEGIYRNFDFLIEIQ